MNTVEELEKKMEETVRVSREIEAREVETGDEYEGLRPGIVEEVKRGNTYVHLKVEDFAGKTFNVKLLFGDPVRVWRWEETFDARRARHTLRTHTKIMSMIEGYPQMLEEVERAVDQLGERLKSTWLVEDSYSDFGSVMERKARASVYGLLVYIYEDGREGLRGDPIAAMRAVKEEATDRILKNYKYNRALSRSTSVVSNLLEDVQRAAYGEFLDREVERTIDYLDDYLADIDEAEQKSLAG